jgi:hypothetical protein
MRVLSGYGLSVFDRGCGFWLVIMVFFLKHISLFIMICEMFVNECVCAGFFPSN